MVDEIVPTPTPAEGAPPEAPPAEVDIRTTPAFKGVLKQLEASNSELAAFKAALADKAAENEKAELEKRGEYDTLTKQLQGELAALKTTHARDIVQRDLTTALVRAGATNDRFINGCVAGYTPDQGDVTAYVSGLAGDEANGAFFGQALPGGQPAPSHGAPAGASTNKSLEDRLASTDPDVLNAARREHWEKIQQG